MRFCRTKPPHLVLVSARFFQLSRIPKFCSFSLLAQRKRTKRKGTRVTWSFGLPCAPRSCRDFANSLRSNSAKSFSTASAVRGKCQWVRQRFCVATTKTCGQNSILSPLVKTTWAAGPACRNVFSPARWLPAPAQVAAVARHPARAETKTAPGTAGSRSSGRCRAPPAR